VGQLPAEVRERVHRTAASLPLFPNNNPELLDPTKWRPAVEDSVTRCRLDLGAWGRASVIPIRSVRELKPGQTLLARYRCARRGWTVPRYVGPRYVWNGRGQLEERAYRESDGTRYRERIYQYRPNGLIWAYRDRERNEDESGPWASFDEYFDPDGTLAGFQIARLEGSNSDSSSAPPDTIAWWRGAPLVPALFQARIGSFAKSD
jgi:hypothetical protein